MDKPNDIKLGNLNNPDNITSAINSIVNQINQLIAWSYKYPNTITKSMMYEIRSLHTSVETIDLLRQIELNSEKNA